MVRYFSKIKTRPARASQIWQILVSKAYNRQTVTYGELMKILGYKGAGVFGDTLAHINYYCKQNDLPPLTVIVVDQETGLPDFPVDKDMNRARENVYRYPWYNLVPPTFVELESAFKDEQ